MTAWVGCASQKSAPDPVKEQAPAGQAAAVEPSSPAGQSPDSFVVDPEKLEFGRYLEEEVDNFLVILDASGSKHLPYKQELKLKVAKDIVRRFNQKTPTRPLFGGLRRYGWEAGAFTTSTSLLYGMTAYNREAFAQGIEIVRWAGGKTPMAPVIEKAGDDLALAPADEYLALVIVSDGKVMKEDPNPVMAARHVKERYGDRICIYTVAVGDDFPFDKRGTPEEKRRYHEKFRLLRDVAREGKCGYMVTAEDLIPDTSMDQFVHDVFHRGRSFEPRIPELAACPDEDADSVCDDVDKCPGTPAGAKVNAEGCWDLGIVWFDLNKWNIKPEYRTMLNDIAHVLKMNRNIKLAVQGHTCTIWTEEYNMKLSHWRAMAVTSYLVSLGVNPDQLAVEGYGFHRPYVDNKTEENRSLNRRVEFRRLQ
jgi:OOP family OmpA-OmpF porin